MGTKKRSESMNKQVIVRFAPSPTGYLHIGGARTAIFNWLYAKKKGGKLVLRIEDTDEERSTEESIQGIIDGLKWLGVSWDQGPYFQSQFIEDHKAAAQKLLESGHAYQCFCTKEDLQQKREEAHKKKIDVQYDGTCRRLTKEESGKKLEEGKIIKMPAIEKHKLEQIKRILQNEGIEATPEKIKMFWEDNKKLLK